MFNVQKKESSQRVCGPWERKVIENGSEVEKVTRYVLRGVVRGVDMITQEEFR